MNRKTKFLASVALLSVSVFTLIMGVYALVQRQITIGGTVSFSASTVRADYLVEKTIAYTGQGAPTFETVSSGSFNVNMQDNADAQLGNIMLSDNAENFAYRVTITSTETVRDLIVSHTVPTFTQDWLSVTVNEQTDPETTHTLTQGQNIAITFVISADAENAPETAQDIDVGSNFTISLTEEDAQTEASARAQRRLLNQQQKQQNSSQIESTNQTNQTNTNPINNINNKQINLDNNTNQQNTNQQQARQHNNATPRSTQPSNSANQNQRINNASQNQTQNQRINNASQNQRVNNATQQQPQQNNNAGQQQQTNRINNNQAQQQTNRINNNQAQQQTNRTNNSNANQQNMFQRRLQQNA